MEVRPLIWTKFCSLATMGLIWLAQMRDSVHQMEFGVVLKLCVKVRWYLRFDICYTKDCWISSWPFLYSTELGSILESKFGNWTACILSFLAKDCGPIRTPINGTKHGTKTTYPSRVTVTCNSGFHLRGSSGRECMSDGVWSGVEAYCEGKEMKFAKKFGCFLFVGISSSFDLKMVSWILLVHHFLCS